MYFLGFLIIFLLNASQSIALKVNFEEEWMGIYSGGDKIGYSHVIFKPNKEVIEILEETKLNIQVSSVSGKSNITFSTDTEPVVSPILFKWLAGQKPKVGKRYVVTLFDPTLILTGAETKDLQATLSIEDEEQITIPYGSFKTYRVKMLFMDSESTYWITEDGEIIKEASPPGLLALRESKEKGLC